MPTYADGEAIYGNGTQIRYAVLAAGTMVRPAAAGAFKVITGVTTSEIKGNQDVREKPKDYDTGNGNWKDSTPGAKGWSFSFSANKKGGSAQAAMLQELWDAWASGANIWIERLVVDDTHWRGGLGFLTDPTEPVPSDGVVSFSAGVTGRGALTRTDVTP